MNRAASPAFVTTRWSMVIGTGASAPELRARSLEELCTTYWYPLYAFCRRLGHSTEDAEDLTQGFFEYLISANLPTRADPMIGRFRSFLLGSFQYWLSNERRRAQALKRGAGRSPVLLEGLAAEERYALEPATDETPAAQYERAWAEALIGQTLDRLEADSDLAPERFNAARPLLLGVAETGYAEAATALNMTESALRVTVHRLRKRFGELLRATIADTVDDAAEVEAELRYLVRLFTGRGN